MPVYNKRGILLLPKVIVLNPKDGLSESKLPLYNTFMAKDKVMHKLYKYNV